MKSIIKYVSFLGLGAAIVLSSCQKKLDEAYANPNATTRVPVETLLPSLIGSMLGSSAASGSAYGIAGDALLIGRYIQYWGTFSTTTSPVSYAASNQSNYDVMAGTVGTSDNLGSVWAAHYFGMGANLNRMVEWASEEQKWDFVGAGWALRAWSLLEATNEYGEMPLREAFNASQQVFKYDVQPEIYDSVRAICFRSLSYFNRTDGNMGQKFADADAYFNKGDIGRWKKFVYGILARSYAYISNKQTYSADSVIKYTDLSMTSNADNATLKFAATGISGTSNYFGPFRGNAGTIRQSAFIADLLSGSNPDIFTGVTDPRAPYLLRENPNGTYKGIIPWKGSTGVSAGDLPSNFWGNPYISTTSSTPDSSRYIFRDNAEFPVMTASEMQFLKAEAAYRKNDRTTALAAYVNGIALNIEMLATKYATNVRADRLITVSNSAAFLMNPAIVPASANDLTLSMIMLQKYIALYGWGVQETWADMRRFHYNKDKDPATGLPVYAGFMPPATELYLNNNGKLVYRARPRYNSEYLYNIPELTRLGALALDYHTKEMWFSQP